MKYDFEIEEDIPIPAKRGRREREVFTDPVAPGRVRYPFQEMEPGDSFRVPPDHPSAYNKKGGMRGCRASAAAHMHASKTGRRFLCRRLEDESVRIWRVS